MPRSNVERLVNELMGMRDVVGVEASYREAGGHSVGLVKGEPLYGTEKCYDSEGVPSYSVGIGDGRSPVKGGVRLPLSAKLTAKARMEDVLVMYSAKHDIEMYAGEEKEDHVALRIGPGRTYHVESGVPAEDVTDLLRKYGFEGREHPELEGEDMQ